MSIHPIVVCSPAALQVVSSCHGWVTEPAQQQWFTLSATELPAVPRPLALLLDEIRERQHPKEPTTGVSQ
jgi:hypothetical protein